MWRLVCSYATKIIPCRIHKRHYTRLSFDLFITNCHNVPGTCPNIWVERIGLWASANNTEIKPLIVYSTFDVYLQLFWRAASIYRDSMHGFYVSIQTIKSTSWLSASNLWVVYLIRNRTGNPSQSKSLEELISYWEEYRICDSHHYAINSLNIAKMMLLMERFSR